MASLYYVKDILYITMRGDCSRWNGFSFPSIVSPAPVGHRTFTDENTKKSEPFGLTNMTEQITLIENREKPSNKDLT
jgi:hypothetical protein